MPPAPPRKTRKPRSAALAEVPRPQQKQIGFVDRVTETQIIGWAIDGDRLDSVARLAVSIDDRLVETMPCSERRDDLSAMGMPSRRAGFIYDIPARLYDGVQHRIAFRFHNGMPVLFTNKLGQSVAEWHFLSSKRAEYEGFVDGLVEGASVDGWVFRSDVQSGARFGGVRLLVFADGSLVDELVADRYRPDVGSAHRCDLYCGFSYTPPPRLRCGKPIRLRFIVANDKTELANSPVDVTFLANATTALVYELLESAESVATQTWQLKQRLQFLLHRDELPLARYDTWARIYFRRLPLRVAAEREAEGGDEALVSILCPVFRPELHHFIAAVQSVRAQSYRNWELIIVDDGSRDTVLAECIADLAHGEPRIVVQTRKRNGGISAATNDAIALARGAYVALFDHDDLLVDVAIEVMMRAARRSSARLLYSDEDKIDERGNLSNPHLKSDWNYRLLLANNYVCHLLVVERALLDQVGGFRSEYDGAQDHDFMLRCAEVLGGSEICHVPEILYHWRQSAASTAMVEGAKNYAGRAGIACIGDHLERRGLPAIVSQIGSRTIYRIAWQCREEPRVAIIIPYKDQIEMTQRCLRALLSLTAYRNYEIVLVDNWSLSTEARAFAVEASNIAHVRVMRVTESFNFSRLNNLAAREVTADYYVFLNNDLFVTTRDWLRVMMNEALCGARVGAVGGKFLYPDGTVQHGGVITGIGGVGDHAFRRLKADDPGYMARALMAQELSAVTAACMLCDARAFAQIGGFDETDLTVAFNDVDLCLKLRAAGYSVIWTPDFVAEHHESLSRGDDADPAQSRRFFHENQTMEERWGDAMRNDPFYNRHFSRKSGIFRLLAEEQ